MATQRGVGMLEFLVALLIFSTGMMGLLSAQLVGKKTIFEASQRSVAITLARDMVERMRANPGQLAAYQVEGIGGEANQQQPPVADCHASFCNPAQLAAFDLWQWESLLRGASEQDAAGKVGGLLSPRACISSSGGAVEVTLSWRGVLADGPASTNSCGDEGMGEVSPPDGEAVRHQLTLATFVVKR
jgi:type IV pilus assembly protein PilV